MRDDGIGAAAAALSHPHRWGVVGRRERAGQFGGRPTIDPAPGQGTRVRLVMPPAAAPMAMPGPGSAGSTAATSQPAP